MKVVGLSSENGIRLKPLKSESKYPRFLFYFAASIIHLFSTLYLIVMGLVHLFLRRKIEVLLAHLQFQTLAGVSYIVLGFLHFYALIKLCVMVCYGRNPPSSPPSTDLSIHLNDNKTWHQIFYHHLNRIYFHFFDPYGIFGRYGKYYETRIALREFIEIPSQMFQAYTMSDEITNRYVAFNYGMLIVLNCFTSPIMLLSSRYTVRRKYSIFIDALFDFSFSVLFPSYLVAEKIQSYVVEGQIYKINDPIWGTEAIHVARQVMVSSLLDLITKLMPFLFNYLLLVSLINSMHNEHIHSYVQVEKIKCHRQSELDSSLTSSKFIQAIISFSSQKWMKFLMKCGSFLAGIGIFTIAYLAVRRNECSSSCLLQVYPWFTNDCQCVLYHFNCNQYMIKNETEVHQHLYTISTRVNELKIVNCPLTTSPPLDSLTRLHQLETLALFETNISSWDIPISSMPSSLNGFFINGGQLNTIPLALRHINSPNFIRFSIGGCSLTSLPNDLSWKELMFLSFERNQLTEFPSIIFKLPSLEMLQLTSNKIQHIHVPDTYISSILNDVDLSDNQLDHIPIDLLKTSSNLKRIYLNGNPIPSTEITNDEFYHVFQPVKQFFLGNTPICMEWERSNQIQEYFQAISKTYQEMCQSHCSEKCPFQFTFNYRCDLRCNNPACNMDQNQCELYL